MKYDNKTKSQLLSELQKIKEEYKQKETELADVQFMLASYFENLPIPAYKISLYGKILDCNRLAVQTLGYEKKQLLGKPLISTIYASVSQEKAKRLFFEWGKKEKIRNEEMKIVKKQGKTLDVLLNVDTISTLEGKPLYSLSTHIDISGQKKSQDKIQKYKNKIRSIFDSHPDAITVTDIEGNIVECNKATLNLHGFSSKKEVIGKNAFELIGKYPSLLNAGSKLELSIKMIVDNIIERGFWEGEMQNIKKNGTVFSTYARIAAFRDENN